ncbi:alpha/beta fold hydrolase [Gordonia polyisoprenivorans]|uniref:alpha/beta fold hydrolase n=1 Tax=Gordonia polyisoprenivorans TaxID=84595 RepID=UPI001AD6C455|nr:alpha/beta hydrolase [Gordonia polyisoprenivorans]QTI69384.1 alpha/beta hydrolase [Gordonia polyisoprenivorans]
MSDSKSRTMSTPLLDIGIEEHGSASHPALVLLHGWPDDVRTWDALVDDLTGAGFRVIVPYLRGFGPTRFHSTSTRRSGQLTALAADLFALLDALGVERFAVIGHDWGARAAYIAAALRPQRVRACAAISVGWGTNGRDQALSFLQTQHYWYQWLIGTPRGENIVHTDRRAFTRHLWDLWNPERAISDTEFARTAASFDTPDWAEITVHSYRVRWGGADPDPAYADAEAAVVSVPHIAVPTLTLHGGADPASLPETSAGRDDLFDAVYRRVVLDDLGHFPQRIAPQRVLDEIVPFVDRHGR